MRRRIWEHIRVTHKVNVVLVLAAPIFFLDSYEHVHVITYGVASRLRPHGHFVKTNTIYEGHGSLGTGRAHGIASERPPIPERRESGAGPYNA